MVQSTVFLRYSIPRVPATIHKKKGHSLILSFSEIRDFIWSDYVPAPKQRSVIKYRSIIINLVLLVNKISRKSRANSEEKFGKLFLKKWVWYTNLNEDVIFRSFLSNWRFSRAADARTISSGGGSSSPVWNTVENGFRVNANYSNRMTCYGYFNYSPDTWEPAPVLEKQSMKFTLHSDT